MVIFPLPLPEAPVKRTLQLRTEVLGALTVDELTQVVGGDALTLPLNTCVVCVTQPSDCVCITRVTQCC